MKRGHNKTSTVNGTIQTENSEPYKKSSRLKTFLKIGIADIIQIFILIIIMRSLHEQQTYNYNALKANVYFPEESDPEFDTLRKIFYIHFEIKNSGQTLAKDLACLARKSEDHKYPVATMGPKEVSMAASGLRYYLFPGQTIQSKSPEFKSDEFGKYGKDSLFYVHIHLNYKDYTGKKKYYGLTLRYHYDKNRNLWSKRQLNEGERGFYY